MFLKWYYLGYLAHNSYLRVYEETDTGIVSQPYRREVMQHFSHLTNHPAVLLTNQLHAHGFWWDSLIELAVTCTAFPEAVLTADLRNSRYVNASEGQENAR